MPVGTVALHFDAATRRLTASVDLFGFTLHSSHAMLLRSGSCAAPGGVVTGFPDLAANAYGVATGDLVSTATLPGAPARGAVEVDLAPHVQAATPPGSTRIACGDLPAGAAQPATLSGFPDATLSATVTLALSATGRLQVHVVAAGLAPASRHAVHIHFGSCRQQSGVLYSVGDVTADGAGNVDSTITLSGVARPPSSGWYADMHDAATGGLETGGQPTLGFQPLLCGNGRA
jgi:hypothetical protein